MSQESSIDWSSAPDLLAASPASIRSLRGGMEELVVPRM